MPFGCVKGLPTRAAAQPCSLHSSAQQYCTPASAVCCPSKQEQCRPDQQPEEATEGAAGQQHPAAGRLSCAGAAARAPAGQAGQQHDRLGAKCCWCSTRPAAVSSAQAQRQHVRAVLLCAARIRACDRCPAAAWGLHDAVPGAPKQPDAQRTAHAPRGYDASQRKAHVCQRTCWREERGSVQHPRQQQPAAAWASARTQQHRGELSEGVPLEMFE